MTKTGCQRTCESEPSPPNDPDADELFELLSNARRRRVRSFLHEADDGAVALDELVDHVVRQGTDGESGDREAAAVALHHVHLPKLADGGVIEYDSRTETVRYRGGPEHDRLRELAVETAGDGS